MIILDPSKKRSRGTFISGSDAQNIDRPWNIHSSVVDKASHGGRSNFGYRHPSGGYPDNMSKEKNRAVTKRASRLTVERGEVYFTKGILKVQLANY